MNYDEQNVNSKNYNSIIDCTGLMIEDVLNCLYENASPIGLGNLQARDESFNYDTIKQLLSESNCFDYLYGRPLKLSFETYPIIDCTVYDEYNYPACFAINKLKQFCVRLPKQMPFNFNQPINLTQPNQMQYHQMQYHQMQLNQMELNQIQLNQTNQIIQRDPMVECETMMKKLYI